MFTVRNCREGYDALSLFTAVLCIHNLYAGAVQQNLPKCAIKPRAPDVHAPPQETACSSDLHNYACHKLD